MRQLRDFFHRRDFIEVTTPNMSRDTVVDRHLDPFVVHASPDSSDATWFLQTSPEFHMKRLLAAGATAIFQIGPAFRVGERGDQHNPEFTIVEWYRCGDDINAGIQLLRELVADCVQATRPNDDLQTRSMTYRDAFISHSGLDPFETELDRLRSAIDRPAARPSDQTPVTPILASDEPSSRLSSDLGPDSTPGSSSRQSPAPDPRTLDRDGCLEWLFVDRVQPHLQSPTIVYDYPVSQAALAQTRIDSYGTEVAERFELFIQGIELANGYHELLDATELSRRNEVTNHLRHLDGKRTLPSESHLWHAMRHGLPPCSGVAMGFDRLLMVTTRHTSIEQVIPFPIERA